MTQAVVVAIGVMHIALPAQAAGPATPPAATKMPEITIEATDKGFKVPAVIQAGLWR